MPETGDLGKDKPHPVAFLPASAQLLHGAVVSTTGVLSRYETLQVERVVQSTYPIRTVLRRFGQQCLSATQARRLTKIRLGISVEVRILPRLYGEDFGVVITMSDDFANYPFHQVPL